MLTSVLKSWVKNDDFVDVKKRYVELVDPETGKTIPYSYAVIDSKYGECGSSHLLGH